jgi:hypothetical protein
MCSGHRAPSESRFQRNSSSLHPPVCRLTGWLCSRTPERDSSFQFRVCCQQVSGPISKACKAVTSLSLSPLFRLGSGQCIAISPRRMMPGPTHRCVPRSTIQFLRQQCRSMKWTVLDRIYLPHACSGSRALTHASRRILACRRHRIMSQILSTALRIAAECVFIACGPLFECRCA